MPHWRRWLGIAGLCIAFGASATACTTPPEASAQAGPPLSPTPSPTPVTVSYARTAEALSGLAIDVAGQQGFLAREGIVVAPHPALPGTADLAAAFASGSIVLGAGSVETALVAGQRGVDLVIVAGLARQPLYSLVAPPELETVAELKGKILVAASRKMDDGPLIKLMLEQAGLRYPGDYDLVVAASLADRVAALESGSVAAALLSPPHDLLLLERGKKRLLAAREAVGDYPGHVLLANRAWAAGHPDLVVRFLRATREGARWLSDPANEGAVVPIIARHTPMEPRHAQATYATYITPPGALASDLRPSPGGLRRAFEALASGRPDGVSNDPEMYLMLHYLERALSAPN